MSKQVQDAPVETADPVRIMWYGDPGVGKTTAVATAARDGKVVMLDCEHRVKKAVLRRLGIPLENLEVHVPSEFKGSTYSGIAELLDNLEARLRAGEPIIAFVWDGMTECQRLMLEDLVSAGVATAEAKGMERSEWRTYQEDYGDVTEQIRRLFRKLARLPIHVGVTALCKRDKDEEGGIRMTANVTPAVLRDLQAAMDVIIAMRVEEVGGAVERAGICQPLGRFDAKDTFGVLPKRMVDASFHRIMRYVDGSVTASGDSVQIAAAARRRGEVQPTKGE